MTLFRIATVGLCAAVLLTVGSSVSAHFNLNINIRTIHFVHTDDGLDVYIRVPTPILLAGLTGAVRDDGTMAPAPYTYNRTETGVLMHYLDLNDIRRNADDFARLAVRGHRIFVDEQPLKGQAISVRIHPALEQPPFVELSEVKDALYGGVFSYPYDEIYVGETVTDVLIRYDFGSAVDTFLFASEFKPGLPDEELLANLILDHYPGGTKVHRLRGLLNEPVEFRNSELAAIVTFVVEGVRHILSGLDHVLFVLCLTIGAATITGLLWRVTGFTIGHTATLSLGFFGFVPGGEWFVHAVEISIALSIIYAAIVALYMRDRTVGEVSNFFVTIAIGLLHGLGFSFVLHEILLPGDAHLWKLLVSFNVGVEIGQVMIVAAGWGILWLVSLIRESFLTPARWAVAMPCIGIATFWVVERVRNLMEVAPSL